MCGATGGAHSSLAPCEPWPRWVWFKIIPGHRCAVWPWHLTSLSLVFSEKLHPPGVVVRAKQASRREVLVLVSEYLLTWASLIQSLWCHFVNPEQSKWEVLVFVTKLGRNPSSHCQTSRGLEST